MPTDAFESYYWHNVATERADRIEQLERELDAWKEIAKHRGALGDDTGRERPTEKTADFTECAELLREAPILQEESAMKDPKGTNKAIRKAARKVTGVAELINTYAGHCTGEPMGYYRVPCKLMDRLQAELKAREGIKALEP